MKENTSKPIIKTLPKQTSELLAAGRYKDAFTLLRRRISELPMPSLLPVVNQAENTYKYMLQYFAQGAEDPGRDAVLADIRRNILDVADILDRESAAPDSPQLYFSTLRISRLRPIDLKAALEGLAQNKSMADLAIAADSYPASLLSQIEETESKIFDLLWVADSLTSDDYSLMSKGILSGYIPFSAASLIIAASGLACMRYYNRNALMMLCDVATSDNPKLSARALVNLVLALNRSHERVADDSRMKDRLNALIDDVEMPKRIRKVVFSLIKTRDTDRVSKKMQKEVIPGLMQFGPDIIKRMKDSLKESSFEDIEANPEWEELLKNSGLEDKLRELTEMQTDGADVMMAAFSNLKGFPFFRHIRNWMLPFSIHHTMLQSLSSISDDTISSLLEINGMMCDSDKYSFAFSLANMPEAQRKMVIGQINGQMDQMREQMQEFEVLNSGHEFDDEVIRYCRDLYRFFKLFPKRGEFYDPFSVFIDFRNLPVLRKLFSVEEDFPTLAEFYFKRGYYSDALLLLEEISNSEAGSPHVWEKIGFCLEKCSDDTAAAIEAYMKAQLFNPDSKWISRRLGICYKKIGDYRNAVDYFKLSLPDDGSFDKRMSLIIADAYASAENWQEALNELYRVDYETPDDSAVVRRMAYCAFRTCDFDKALGWLDDIPELERSEEDYLLRGHIEFLRRNFNEAIKFYRLTVRPNDKRRLWKSIILEDADVLESMGASRRDLILLLESMTYALDA